MGVMDSQDSISRYRILVVDDEAAVAQLLSTLLEQEGFLVTVCHSGTQALKLFTQESFDLIILDVAMPGMNGFEVCRIIRSSSDIPIIFLSAKDEEMDKVIGLTLGADDYVVKPFRPQEFIARVRARLRRLRVESASVSDRSCISGRGIELDVGAHTVTLYDQPLHLTPKEFEILAVLLRAQGSPVSTSQLFERVWHSEPDASASNAVMVHIRHLRQKFAAIDRSETFIETVWGVGYRITVASGSSSVISSSSSFSAELSSDLSVGDMSPIDESGTV